MRANLLKVVQLAVYGLLGAVGVGVVFLGTGVMLILWVRITFQLLKWLIGG